MDHILNRYTFGCFCNESVQGDLIEAKDSSLEKESISTRVGKVALAIILIILSPVLIPIYLAAKWNHDRMEKKHREIENMGEQQTQCYIDCIKEQSASL